MSFNCDNIEIIKCILSYFSTWKNHFENCIFMYSYTRTGKNRLTVVHMEKDMQVMTITIALLTHKNVTWPSSLRYNIISAQIAGLHYLYILVVYLLNKQFCVLTSVNHLLPTLVVASA